MRLRHGLALTVVLATAAWLTVWADDDRSGTFAGAIEVRVVNLQAVVTDTDGNLVPGLSADDFRLLVDGREVPIEYFSEVRDRTVVQGTPPGAAPAAEAAAPPAGAEPAADQPPPPMGTGYLVLVDEFFSLPPERNQALASIAAELDRIGPEDSMAVVAFGGDGLHTLTNWTSSAEKIVAALNEAVDRPAGGAMRRWEALDAEARLEKIDYADRLRDQTEEVVAAATSAMRAVHQPEGRKVMILLAGGWPLDPSRLLRIDDQRRVDRKGKAWGEDLFRPLVDEANLLGWTLYPVDVPGLRADELASEAERLGFDIDEAWRQPNPRSGLVIETPSTDTAAIQAPEPREGQREREDQFTLEHLAKSTGGEPVIHGRLDQIFQDTRSYYWLGFSPRLVRDDELHEVTLEASRPGLRVRARTSYLDDSLASQIRKRVEAALLSGGLVGDAGLEVTVGAVQAVTKKRVMVPLEITIPTDEVVATPTDQGYTIELELRAAALDDWGRPSDIPVVPVTFQAAHPPAPGGFAKYRTSVEVDRKVGAVLVTIYDPRLDNLLVRRVELPE